MGFTRFILFLIGFAAGILIIYWREKIVRIFGKNDMAEKYLGMGGTYNMWVLIGMAIMIAGLLIVLGKLEILGL